MLLNLDQKVTICYSNFNNLRGVDSPKWLTDAVNTIVYVENDSVQTSEYRDLLRHYF